MLSLVNYGSSGESDSEGEEVEVGISNSKGSEKCETSNPPPFNNGSDIDDTAVDDPAHESSINDERSINVDDKPQEEKKITSSLPAPISSVLDVNWDQLSKLRFKSGSIKILAPPIPKDEEPVKKEKRVPSCQGSGLLALLPKPKNDTTSSFLTPRSVQSKTNPLPKPKILKPSTLRKKAATPAKPSSDSEDEESGGDFFSLSSINESIPVDESLKLKFPEPEIPDSSTSAVQKPAAEMMDETPMDFIPVQDQDIELDEEALKHLCGSRGLKRKAEELRMIDIDGSQMTPDSQTMLTKNLTAEMPRPIRAKGLGVTSQQKRKHQITYLAQQAKEQELELQNTWAQNRMSRKQTQAKYGF